MKRRVKPSRHTLRSLGRCGPTGKRMYTSETSAMQALSDVRALQELRSRRQERRAYRCPLCSRWHLTSQDRLNDSEVAT